MKHAYLVLCHTDFPLLKTLVQLLDDECNDIFIHVDKKADFSGSELSAKKAGLYVLEQRLDARWGDFSLVEAELLLFETAHSKNVYPYYHLLSGADLPLKSQKYIHDWCNNHPGFEYIGFSGMNTDNEALKRTNYYYCFSRYFCSSNIFIKVTRRIFLLLQGLIPFRKQKDIIVKKGPQWCSVTHDFVSYLLQNKKNIKTMFSHTYCPDELFIQTFCWNSSFRNKVYDVDSEFDGCMRYIVWEKGELKNMNLKMTQDALMSNRWFARKFSSIRTEVVDLVVSRIS